MGGPSPTEQPQRIEAIDALRGFALVGIYFVNITIMGGPIASEAPPGPATLADPNWQIWALSQLFVLGSMRGLFSMLFGASMLLFLRTNSRATFLRRSFWLACFGLANGTLLLWPGDILLIYGLAAPLLLLFLRASNTRLFMTAALIMAALSIWSLMRATGGGGAEDAEAAAAALAAERGARLGDYAANLHFMWQVSLEWTFTADLLWWIGDATALMLIGMALMRGAVLTGKARTSIYVALAAAGFALGLAMRGWATARVGERR